MQAPQIFIATHKKFTLPQNLDDCYLPIQVGVGDDVADYIRENTFDSDNIAEKNANYCELTALYYIWKNIQADIVGLVHYRRYFVKRCNTLHYVKNKIFNIFNIHQKKMSDKYYIISHKEINDILTNYDLIVPKAYYLENTNVYQDYIKTHYERDWRVTEQILLEKHPNYHACFLEVSNSNHFIPCNAFIGKKQIISNYCIWLFDILFALEERIDLSHYDNYNKRVFGFLSERLFTVWIKHNSKKYRFHYLDLRFYNE